MIAAFECLRGEVLDYLAPLRATPVDIEAVLYVSATTRAVSSNLDKMRSNTSLK